MRIIRVVITFLAMSLLLVSCNNGSDDNGTTGGSGNVDGTTGGNGNDNDTTDGNGDGNAITDNSPPETSPPAGSASIYLNASSDFVCTSNWTVRDGAWGLKAYTGSGSCNASFPGTSGTYSMTVEVQTEHDGQSPYLISINGQDVKGGRYPFAGGGCNCPDGGCPDRNQEITVGTFNLETGDSIGFWGDEDFPCGHDHGSYAKWHGMRFTRIN